MAITPLTDGGYVETTAVGSFLHLQKYDAAGTPVGADHVYFSPFSVQILALPNGGYVLTYTPFTGGGHGPSSTGMDVFDATSTATGGAFFPQSSGSVVAISSDAFAVSVVRPAFSNPESDASFGIYDLSGAPLTGFVIDNRPTITVLPSGDFEVRWSDDGGGAHTLVIDPQNPPSLSPPATPVVTAFDNVGPVQGEIDTVTDDTTPTIRVAVNEVGAIETGRGYGVWFGVTADDVARGYKDIELTLPNGAFGFSLELRFQDADGLLSEWTGIFFTVDPTSQTLTGNDTPGQILTGSTGNDAFYAGRNSVVMTGSGGADVFVFQHLPWNGARITDFALGTDRLDFTALFAASGYTGFDPVADGYMRFDPDGQGGTRVYFDPDGPASGNPWPFLMTTLEGVSPIGLTASALFYPSSPPPTGGLTVTANNTRDQVLIGSAGSDIFLTGLNSVVMIGGGSDDTFVFQHVPWNNTGHIMDFSLYYDRLDLSALFAAVGYTGSDPVADGYIRLEPDGAGGTRIQFDADGFGSGIVWPSLITTLDHLPPEALNWQVLSTGYAPQPPGLVLTANDTPGQILEGGGGPDIFDAGHNSAIMTGHASTDLFVFNHLPWNGARITDFEHGVDVLDLRPLFDASGYAGVDPIADGYLRFESDGAGGTRVQFDPDGPASGNPWAFLIVTLDNVQPSSMNPNDWIY
jgi:hypothetical protein